jgi:hypothetical protein
MTTHDPAESLEATERTVALHRAVVLAETECERIKAELKEAKESLALARLDMEGHLHGLAETFPLFDRSEDE